MSGINWLEASVYQVRDAYVLDDYDGGGEPWANYVHRVIIPEVSRAVEAKVRGEQVYFVECDHCDFKLQYDGENARDKHGTPLMLAHTLTCEKSPLVRQVRDLLRRAETAEAERDAAVKRGDEYRDVAVRLDRENADAKREGGYEALTKYAEWSIGRPIGQGAPQFRDTHYAPSPAPLMLGGWSVTWDGTRFNAKSGAMTRSAPTACGLFWIMSHDATNDEYAALCQLKENASNA